MYWVKARPCCPTGRHWLHRTRDLQGILIETIIILIWFQPFTVMQCSSLERLLLVFHSPAFLTELLPLTPSQLLDGFKYSFSSDQWITTVSLSLVSLKVKERPLKNLPRQRTRSSTMAAWRCLLFSNSQDMTPSNSSEGCIQKTILLLVFHSYTNKWYNVGRSICWDLHIVTLCQHNNN